MRAAILQSFTPPTPLIINNDPFETIIMSRVIEYPTTDDIHPDQANFLFENHCAILVLEDLPIGSEFGIDLAYFRIGERFKGIKLIPPGVHFVYASAVEGLTSRVGPRCGFFHDFKPKELSIKKWSTKEEDFDAAFCPSEDEIGRYSANIKDLDRFLGIYKFSTYQNYLNLSVRLDSQEINRLMPDCGVVRSVPCLTRGDTEQNQEQKPTRRPRRFNDHNLMPDLKPDQRTVIHFTVIPETHLDSLEQVDPSEVTDYNLDTTRKLEQAFSGDSGKINLLAEFQFAFLVFILCHTYECFEQWKSILHLVCHSDAALRFCTDDSSYILEFILTLRSQFDQIPNDLFEDIVDEENLIRDYLDTFFQNIRDCHVIPINSRLRKASMELRSYLEDKFGWQFELSPKEEDQPVIVEML